MKLISSAGVAVILTGCATTGGAGGAATGATASSADMRIGAHSYVTKSCSVAFTPPKPGTDELGLLATIAAPIIGGILKGGFDALGTAISAAGAEKSEVTTSTPGTGFFYKKDHPKTRQADLSGKAVQAPTQTFCVRTLMASFPQNPSISTTPDSTVRPANFGAAVTSKNYVSAVKYAFKPKTSQSISTPYHYSEYLVYPVKKVDGNTLYQVQPLILWYFKSSHGNKFKLASQTLQIKSVASVKDEVAISYAQTFDPKGLVPGTFLTHGQTYMPPSGYLVAPPITAASTKELADVNAEIKRLNLILSAPKLTKTNDIVEAEKKVVAANEAISVMTCEKEKVAADKALCETNRTLLKSQTILNELKAELEKQKSAKANKQALDKAIESIKLIPDYFSAFNVTVSFNETREPNKFYQIVGTAISDSKKSRDEALDAYVNKQTGVTEKTPTSPKLAEAGAYRLARLNYDIAKRKYDEAVLKSVQTDIDAAQILLLTAYNDLIIRGAAVEEVVTEVSPY